MCRWYSTRAETDEQAPADLTIRQTAARERGDAALLRGQIVARLDRPLADRLARGHQLTAGPFGECLHADRGERVVGAAQLGARIYPPALASQPFAVQEVGAGQIDAHLGAPETVQRLAVAPLGRRAAG